MTITGATRLYTIVADPIGQVRAPEVLNHYFQDAGHDGVMVPVHVDAAGLSAVLDGFRRTKNMGGFVITVPHKTAVAQACDELGPTGRVVGSVNAVRREPDGRLVGEMFDGKGFVAGLRLKGHEPAGKRVLLLGAGGAAGAIAYALLEAGVASLVIANRTRAKAEAVIERLRPDFPDADVRAGDADPADCDIVVNATSLGMKPDDALPIDVSLLQPRHLVAEIIMKPETTALLARAGEAGCTVHYGRHMLDEQIRLIAEFLGVQAKA